MSRTKRKSFKGEFVAKNLANHVKICSVVKYERTIEIEETTFNNMKRAVVLIEELILFRMLAKSGA